MLRKRLLLITLFAGGSVLACAQQSAAKAPSIPPAAPVTKADPLKLSTGIRASYYHPDDLSALDCGVVLDWNSVFKQLNQTVPADRLKVLNGMTIEVHARRGKSTSEQISWANGAPTDSEHL